MATTSTSLKEIQATARQEHDDFTQNTHKEETCSAVGSILIKLEKTLGAPDTSEAYFRGWVGELVTLKVIQAEEEAQFFTLLWSFLRRGMVVRDDDKIKIYDPSTKTTTVITKTLSEMLALTIMAIDDEEGFDSSFKKTEALAQIVEHLRFAFDNPRLCNTGVRNSIVEVLHKQYRFLDFDGNRSHCVAYVLSDLGSDIEGVMRNFFADELALLLHSSTATDRERGYRLLSYWMRDNLDLLPAEPLPSDDAHQDYLSFRAKRRDVQAVLQESVHQFFMTYSVDPLHPDVQRHINERLPLFTQLDYPDVKEFSKEMQDLFNFLSHPSAFPESSQAAIRACTELSTAAALIRPELRKAALLEQAQRYHAQLPLGAAEQQLQQSALVTIQRLLTLNPNLPANERLAKISQWEDELNERHSQACLDNNEEVIANSFAHLLSKMDHTYEFLMVLEDCLRRPSMKITERELRSLLESIPRKEGSVKLHLSPQVVNAILWHALRTTPLDWSPEFQTIMTLLIEQFEGPQKHYNDQKWIHGSYPQECIDLFKWLNDCARHQEIRYMPQRFFMPCTITNLERNPLFREWFDREIVPQPTARPFPMRGWFFDFPLDPTWSVYTSLNILRHASPQQIRAFATTLIQRHSAIESSQKLAMQPLVFRIMSLIPYGKVRQDVVLKHWMDFDITTKHSVLTLVPFNNLFLLELSQKIKTVEDLRVLEVNPRLSSNNKLKFINMHYQLLKSEEDIRRVLMTGPPEHIMYKFALLRMRLPPQDTDSMLVMLHGTQIYELALYSHRLSIMETELRMRPSYAIKLTQKGPESIVEQIDFLRLCRLRFCAPAGISPQAHPDNFLFLKPFLRKTIVNHPVYAIFNGILGKLSHYFSEGILENADALIDLYEQSVTIDWDPQESQIIARSKECFGRLRSGDAPLPEVLSDTVPNFSENPEIECVYRLHSKINSYHSIEVVDIIQWGEIVQDYQWVCRLSYDNNTMTRVLQELQLSPASDLSICVKTQILMKAMTTPLHLWDANFKALVKLVAKRKGFSMLFKNSGKYKCDAQLSWMAEPHIEEFKLDNIVFPFTLGQCPVDPITEDIAEGIMGGLIVWQHLSPNLETYIEKSLETLGYALTRAMLCLPTNEREALYQRYIALVSDDELVSAIFALPTECWNVECTRWAESGLTVFLAYMPLKGFLYFLDEYSEGNPTVFTPYFETQGSSIKLLIESMEGKENEDCYRLIDAWKRRTLRFTNLNFEEEMRNLKIVAAVSLENGKTPTGAVEERVYRFK